MVFLIAFLNFFPFDLLNVANRKYGMNLESLKLIGMQCCLKLNKSVWRYIGEM